MKVFWYLTNNQRGQGSKSNTLSTIELYIHDFKDRLKK